MKKVFISQVMQGLSEDQIHANRKVLIERTEEKLGEIEVIDSIIRDTCPNSSTKNRSVWYLANSILKMAEADIVVFEKGYENSRGTNIENQIAKDYGIIRLEF